MPMPQCASPRLDKKGLAGCPHCSNMIPPRHRHQCEVVPNICSFNGTLWPVEKRRPLQRQQLQRLRHLRVRSPVYSHHELSLKELHPLRPPEPSSATEKLLRRSYSAAAPNGFSECLPLVWLPVWPKNFFESFIASVAPIFELLDAGLITRDVLLRPDFGWKSRLPGYRHVAFFSETLQPMSSTALRSFAEEAPQCAPEAAERTLRGGGAGSECTVQCYRHLLFCQFRSIYDYKQRYAKPFAPFRTAQWIAARAIGLSSADGLPGRGLGGWRVTFVNRSRTSMLCDGCVSRANLGEELGGNENIRNLGELTQVCASVPPRAECRAHEFGRRGLAADVAVAQSSDVLIGTHGAGLLNCLFMPHGSAVLEVRLFGFEGKWPDAYLPALLRIERAIMFFKISTGDPSLVHPPPPAHATGWLARNGRDVTVPPRTLADALRTIFWANRSMYSYEALPHAFVSWACVHHACEQSETF